MDRRCRRPNKVPWGQRQRRLDLCPSILPCRRQPSRRCPPAEVALEASSLWAVRDCLQVLRCPSRRAKERAEEDPWNGVEHEAVEGHVLEDHKLVIKEGKMEENHHRRRGLNQRPRRRGQRVEVKERRARCQRTSTPKKGEMVVLRMMMMMMVGTRTMIRSTPTCMRKKIRRKRQRRKIRL